VPDKNSYYKRQIVRQLYFADTLSNAELSTRTRTSLPLSTKILNELLEKNVIIAAGHAPSTGGRRAMLYSMQAESLYIVAVAMEQLFTRIVILDMRRRMVTETEKFELHLPNNPSALTTLVERIQAHIQQSGIKKDKIVGVGIGMPGFVDSNKGINFSFMAATGHKHLAQHIADKLDIPTFIENDSSIIALAELRFGAVRNKRNAMVINLGWGIGLGLILNGELFRGSHGLAGEFSHLPLFSNHKLCSCGKMGCLETESSLQVIIEKGIEGIQHGRLTVLKGLAEMNFDQATMTILREAEKGDLFAVELVSEAAYNIGRGVAILLHLLNPETVVLGGRGAMAGKIWQAPVQQALNEHCIPRLAAGMTIETSTLGFEAELIGAAALVMDNYGKGVTSRNTLKKSPMHTYTS
jgi:predicted NBD/HSP70 family sugar kinase